MAEGYQENPMLAGFTIRKILSTGDDANAFIGTNESGFYSVQTGVSNVPTNWGVLLVIGSSIDGCRQIYIAGYNIYMRAYGGTPREWTKWTRYDGTLLSS